MVRGGSDLPLPVAAQPLGALSVDPPLHITEEARFGGPPPDSDTDAVAPGWRCN